MRLDPEDFAALKPLITEVVRATLAELQPSTSSGPPRAYTEAEAAELLGYRPHQLRDERRRGRIRCSYGPRRSPRYTDEQIREYLARQQQ